ncbi:MULTISPECIES: amino acid ABC transporter permease [unclassified Cryobacterium]|uniref:amino acid ABC transporter permease n=1 Tax=unclassified Cryobacterium TaxID=2649013 RepID=UPI00106C1B8A|nr:MULTISPECIES: amino acid ABC transporter permease [unclassified Cryobacterium]TFD02985.1 amino acid ABC transporter permease [Cryobacterium sp. TMT1-66-1]TFD15330.1 amino acid ABC transporter permease [Cryobacterium sp. TMT1-2-2]
MSAIFDNFDYFLSGWLGTLQICAIAVVGALSLGILIAAARVSPVPVLEKLARSYLVIFLNCPFALVLFFIAFGLPEIGLNGSYFTFGVAGLTLYTGAFMAEAIRSGINSVSVGQAEAARSLGMGPRDSLTFVIIPQALRSSVPPMTNVIAQMIKGSAIVGAFGVGGDLFKVADDLIAARGLPAIPILLGVIAGYLLMIMPVSALLGALERKVAIAR